MLHQRAPLCFSEVNHASGSRLKHWKKHGAADEHAADVQVDYVRGWSYVTIKDDTVYAVHRELEGLCWQCSSPVSAISVLQLPSPHSRHAGEL
jgi:hypothetical protein